MIFKQLKDGETRPFQLDNQEEIANEFSFSIIDKLLYQDHESILKERIQKEIDLLIFPDLIASLLQNLYKRGFVRVKAFRNALASIPLILTSDNSRCDFLGLVQKGEEENKPNTNINFYKSFVSDPVKGYVYSEQTDNLLSIFDANDFTDSINIFFVAGCQSIEMLDPRVRKTAIVLSELMKLNTIYESNIKIILSGWNNAKESKHQKVKFSNESAIMTNLLLHKIEHYLSLLEGKNFSYKNIIPEMNSADTKQNLAGLLAVTKQIINESKEKFKKYNFFIASSSFHLLQIQNGIKSQIDRPDSELNTLLKDYKYDFFYLGAENPLYFFKPSDDAYMKLLFNWTIHKNFKFLR
jgi:hypothetical protein